MIYFNSITLQKNFDKLREYFCELDYRADILLISETKLESNNILRNIDRAGYQSYHANSESNAWGVAIYNNYNYITIIIITIIIILKTIIIILHYMKDIQTSFWQRMFISLLSIFRYVEIRRYIFIFVWKDDTSVHQFLLVLWEIKKRFSTFCGILLKYNVDLVVIR